MPVLAIIGRPNVGKSTLFNRLTGKRLALVDDRPGVTRDRRQGEARLGDLSFRVYDTAGLEEADAATLAGRMRAQTLAAVAQADAVLFVIDVRAGITPADRAFAEIVRRAGKPVVLVANKAEGAKGLTGSYEGFALGLGDPIPVSAEHGEGMADLRDAIVAALPGHFVAPLVASGEGEASEAASESTDIHPLRICVVGRPNAGKSTLVNALIGEERLLTGPEAGITRDAIAVEWQWRGRDVRLFDTAGIRRKARIEDKLEKLSVSDALRAIQFAEVVVLLLDATMPFEKQDLTLADLIEREGRACVIAINKWDLVADRPGKLKELRETAERLLPQIRGCRVVPVSGLAPSGLDAMMAAIFETAEVWNTRVATAKLNRWLEAAVTEHPPPAVSGRRIKLRYITQAKARPPHFALFGNQLSKLPESYIRYLVNSLREHFVLPGVPIRLSLRQGENPYDKK